MGQFQKYVFYSERLLGPGTYHVLTETIYCSSDKKGFHLVHIRAESRVLDKSSKANFAIVFGPRTADLHLHMIYSYHLWYIELSSLGNCITMAENVDFVFVLSPAGEWPKRFFSYRH